MLFDQKNRLIEIISKNALERIEKEIELENPSSTGAHKCYG